MDAAHSFTPFYFNKEEEKRIDGVSEMIIDMIIEKHLAYAEAAEVPERCKMLIQKRQII